ncbi:RNA polymerase sigma factor [Shewanella maritima]|uniref:RNA polymerase sigma factor n=1 Tax=Shewanella maritima TaxID=2520507 RepID=UPI003734D436
MDTATAESADELQLIQQATQGDKSAFQALYQRHHQRVYALCLRMAANTELADELCQDCFVRLWHKLAMFDGRSQFSTWLHRLCVRQILNSLKAHQRFWQRFLPEDTLSAEQVEQMQVSEPYHQLDKLIMQLPERMRMVFVLSAMEGYQHDEIAVLLDIAVGTSKNQLFKAKQQLQEMLK